MSNLEFHMLGSDPENEATRLKALYGNEGVDESVRHEFETTVEVYTTLSPSDVIRRIETRYQGDNPIAIGCLAVYDGIDVGSAFWGSLAFQSVEQTEPTEGINVSAWLLKQYRGKGLGKQLLSRATQLASMHGELLKVPVWTSIEPENIASVKACEGAGFKAGDVQLDKPERQIFLLEPR